MYRIIILFLFVTTTLSSQSIDTTKAFPLDSFLTWVRNYHPVMRQVALLEGKANANLLQSRGTFDPKVYGEYEDKSFDGKNYFRIGEAGLKIPTWFGADFKLAYSWTNGIFLNPENNLPERGQAIAGIEVPLGRGLLFDQRRAEVQLGKLYQQANEVEQRRIINDLLLKAVESYWQWAYHYQVVSIYQTALQLAEDRFQIIRQSFLQGDKPAIDTLESLIQMQNRRLELDQALVNYENARLDLSNFLWFDDLIPLELTEQLQPESLETDWQNSTALADRRLIDRLEGRHPQLQKLLIKQEELKVKERLKKEAFKPQLDLSFNFLADGFDFTPSTSSESTLNNLLTENYKWGVRFSYPLFLRKARGGLDFVRVEQLETNAKFQAKRLELQNKINVVIQQLETTFDQLNTQEEVLANYQSLLNAENEKFRIGESSIFLVNNREQKLIETQLKLRKLQTNYQKLRRKLDWAKGQLL